MGAWKVGQEAKISETANHMARNLVNTVSKIFAVNIFSTPRSGTCAVCREELGDTDNEEEEE